ncbi:uncharacterized protein EI90DRAFT_3018072 [Cantharellus anzutake]|uniref:uncharacterized protein n=1 Tax=Cantharellus anzutake TaxID=1750568 RepID=UPI0019079B6E|nr:uncharacterized protein EI90DRAFT_3018072 [Cantharellus anzutake]KAF8327572.1 hypothetical protein EI90DRAFT_3018072 [Cantharellus anzutake]
MQFREFEGSHIGHPTGPCLVGRMMPPQQQQDVLHPCLVENFGSPLDVPIPLVEVIHRRIPCALEFQLEVTSMKVMNITQGIIDNASCPNLLIDPFEVDQEFEPIHCIQEWEYEVVPSPLTMAYFGGDEPSLATNGNSMYEVVGMEGTWDGNGYLRMGQFDWSRVWMRVVVYTMHPLNGGILVSCTFVGGNPGVTRPPATCW